MASAPTGVNAPENSAISTCPELPGDDLYAHAATQHLEQLDAFLTGKELLVVAQGGDSDAVRQIVDFDLSEIPELPPEHPQHERRHESRIKNRMQNSVNEMKRQATRFREWTAIYVYIRQSTMKNSPMFSRELLNLCDLSIARAGRAAVPGGHFDGPLAYRMLRHKLLGGSRTDTDKDYYRTAERLQRSSHLADGCAANEYAKKAYAFLVYIRPNLVQAYDDDETTKYLIDLMPKCLREGGRRIKNELINSGRQHDFPHVISKCRELVLEEQKAAPPCAPRHRVGRLVPARWDERAVIYGMGEGRLSER